jgi:hypothetical protein
MADPAECNCEGGWKHLAEATIAHEHPEPERVEGEADEDYERRAATWRNDVAMARNTWYPCRTHNESAFWRWAQGHWAQHHDRQACSQCDEVRSARRTKRKTEPQSELAKVVDFTQPKEQERF